MKKNFLGSDLRILAVSAGAGLLSSLSECFASIGSRVVECTSSAEGLHRAGTEFFDLVLVDSAISALDDGFLFCRDVRGRLAYHAPVMLFLHSSTREARDLAYVCGADEALTLPLDAAEVRARGIALARRCRMSGGNALRWGGLSLDPRENSVEFRGRSVCLRPFGFRLMEMLIRRAPAVVTKDEILHRMYGNEVANPDSLRTQVLLLRRSLREIGCSAVATVPHVGYALRPEGEGFGALPGGASAASENMAAGQVGEASATAAEGEEAGPFSCLLVSGDAELRALFEDSLASKVTWVRSAVRTAAEAEEALASRVVSALVFDMQVEDMNGFSFCIRLREELHDTTPLVILVEEGSMGNRALNMGADDYLVKPVDGALLAAKLGVLEARRNSPARRSLSWEDIELNEGEHSAAVQGGRLNLSPSMFRMLVLLMEKTPSPVSTQEMAEMLYGGHPPKSGVMRVLLLRLRRELERAGFCIRRVPARGMILERIGGRADSDSLTK